MSLYELLSAQKDLYASARLVEPYLGLLKSRELYQLYDALRYEKDYQSLCEQVEQQTENDYRLKKFVNEFKLKLKVE